MDRYTLNGARVVILDADGVLRRLPDGDSLDRIPALEALLLRPEFADVLIVAAGTWKDCLTLQQMRKLFSDGLCNRIVGATPSIQSVDECRSHVEIHAWLEEHPEIGDYMVLESGAFWTQFPALESAMWVPFGSVLGERALEVDLLESALRRMVGTTLSAN